MFNPRLTQCVPKNLSEDLVAHVWVCNIWTTPKTESFSLPSRLCTVMQLSHVSFYFVVQFSLQPIDSWFPTNSTTSNHDDNKQPASNNSSRATITHFQLHPPNSHSSAHRDDVIFTPWLVARLAIYAALWFYPIEQLPTTTLRGANKGYRFVVGLWITVWCSKFEQIL